MSFKKHCKYDFPSERLTLSRLTLLLVAYLALITRRTCFLATGCDVNAKILLCYFFTMFFPKGKKKRKRNILDFTDL